MSGVILMNIELALDISECQQKIKRTIILIYLGGNIIMKLTPLGDRVVLKQLEAETTTKSGIVLTTATQEKPQEAEVVAVGPGTEDVKMEVSVGQKVIYSKYAGTEVKLEDEEFIIVKQNDILAVVE